MRHLEIGYLISGLKIVGVSNNPCNYLSCKINAPKMNASKKRVQLFLYEKYISSLMVSYSTQLPIKRWIEVLQNLPPKKNIVLEIKELLQKVRGILL
jgi:hypothetical protein